jgi:hypothetical protein
MQSAQMSSRRSNRLPGGFVDGRCCRSFNSCVLLAVPIRRKVPVLPVLGASGIEADCRRSGCNILERRKMTKRYLLFAGKRTFPNGGWKDFKGSFDSIDECRTSFSWRAGDIYISGGQGNPLDWYQIVDSASEDVVCFCGRMLIVEVENAAADKP